MTTLHRRIAHKVQWRCGVRCAWQHEAGAPGKVKVAFTGAVVFKNQLKIMSLLEDSCP